MKKKVLFISLSLVFSISSLVTVFGSNASAAPVTGFKAGRIIDDAVFTKKNSMSASKIQSFLKSKVPSCDTNGTKKSEYGGGTRAQYGRSKGYPPPYKCLKNYTQGGKTAAQIIYDAAQEFKINPQVLIVLLQKEQGLVTDTWPWSIQYRSATGYGCPDTAACASEYYGFKNQVRWSARMFRAIMNNSNTWYTPYSLGNNKVYWHPDLSRCGSSTVNIQNRATVALYSYTPYRPNQAALNAGYGTGNSCSSYGNRNFYQYFKDWFGSPSATYAASVTDIQIYTDEDRTDEVNNIPTLRSGEQVYITVKAKNTGSYTWNRSITRLATINPNNRVSRFADDSWLSTNRPAQLAESSVAPGATGTFNFSMTAPAVDGAYTEKFGVVAEGKKWMSDNSTMALNATVSNPYNSSVSNVTAYSNESRTTKTSSRVQTGSTSYWRVNAKNIGTNSWSNSIVKIGTTNPNNRASTLSNDDWLSSGRLTRLSQPSVSTGGSGTFDFSLTAPSSEQSTVENYGILAENQAWMPNGKFTIRLSAVDRLDLLKVNQSLYSTEVIVTNKHRLVLQWDGNLVLYNKSGKALWHTKTNGKGGNRLVLQHDGNLVLYNTSGKALWHTRTNRKGGNRLILQHDGNLVLYNTSGKALWHTKTNGK